uniref:helix-turn-helix domain-containing protein n=1 Tax=Streptomyces sp. CA-136453 TaxID=3240050 RepID=UPI003F4950DA
MPLQDGAAHPDEEWTIARALNLLFEGAAAAAKDGKEPTNRKVADSINRKANAQVISYETIRKIRQGGYTPSIDKVHLLADLFQVPLDYFRPGDTQRMYQEQYERLVQYRKQAEEVLKQAAQAQEENARVQYFGRKFGGLTPTDQERTIKFIKKLEGLEKMEEDL